MRKFQVIVKAEDAASAQAFVDSKNFARTGDTKKLVENQFVMVIQDDDLTDLPRALKEWFASDLFDGESVDHETAEAQVTDSEFVGGFPFGSLLSWSEITGSDTASPGLGDGESRPGSWDASLLVSLDSAMHKGHGDYCRKHDLFDCWFCS